MSQRYVRFLQVVLKYTLGTGQIILPRSQNPAHMNESLNVYSLQFVAEDVMLLQSLDGKRPFA